MDNAVGSFVLSAQYLINEGFSNINCSINGFKHLIINRNLWIKIYVYKDKSTGKYMHSQTKPDDLGYIYENSSRFILIDEFIDIKR